ncbi:non-ribosomal peptide synthetase [Lasiosphaeria hispida]|uniref:Non-ribosomal peptide synthetase n=1 Tax=Lasiosphaeria hispida TaxID=260671 RepID=A0AAJ0MIR0_9PEZI|nr:non-ribosomal peptide synthetase [Lasiosphaeria hispida]
MINLESDPTGLAPCRFPRFSRSGINDAVASSQRQLASTQVTVEQAEKLLGLSKTDPGSLVAILQASWALLLRCYTGQDGVGFGFQPGGDGPCKPFVAYFSLDGAMTVSELAGAAKTGVAAHHSNHSLDVNTAIALRGFDASNLTLSTSSLSSTIVSAHECHHWDLRLLVKRGQSTISLFLEWSSNFLGMPSAQGELVASTFGAILDQLAANPHSNTPLGALRFLSPANVAQIRAWNDTRSIDPVERCIHHVIADQVHQRPDAEAVCAWDGSLTYHHLDAISSRLAAQLVQLGVRPETLVPLCFNKSKWTVVAMLSVLKAGGAFVPLDPAHPVGRLRGLCKSVNAKLVLCSREHIQMLAGVVEQTLAVDDMTVMGAEELSNTDTPAVSVANTAYVIFTSGSTGAPKGTVIEHRAFCSSARAHAPALRIDDTCRVLQFAAHTFDASLVEMLTSLMVGACVCIPDELERLNDLAGAINRMGVNYAVLTPSFIGFLTPAAVPGLGRLVLAGEAMSSSHVATWSHITLVNGYGPAESSVAAVVNPKVGPDTDPTNIGLPCGVRCWLVDPSDHDYLAPVGCVGEMLLEGPSLARGYLNDPSKTQESFVFDPLWARDAVQYGLASRRPRRFYKTGDLARYNSASGSLSYVGRKDTQIKFHGQRIELGEVEHHLAVDAAVNHAMVLLPKLGPLQKRMVAVVSLPVLPDPSESQPTNRNTAEDALLQWVGDAALTKPILSGIRTRLGTHLPAYMVPSVWIFVGRIPMLASSKLNRKAVTAWVETGITEEECQKIIMCHQMAEAVEPKDANPPTAAETLLRDIWSAVLNLPASQISVDGHRFLNLGGDSITAMACASRAKKMHIDLTAQDVLRAESLRQLAAGAKTMTRNNEDRDSNEDEMLNIPFDLSPIQQLHFQARGMAQGDQHFNQSFRLRITRHVDKETVRIAAEAIVKRHAMLRARFMRLDDGLQWQQFITDDVASSYRFRAHVGASEAEADSCISSAQGCLDVQQGPLLAVELFDAADGGCQILFMTAHHLVIDLVSWRVILEEVEELLEKRPLGADCARFIQPSVPFWKWIDLQKNDCAAVQLEHVLPSAAQVPAAHFGYWGMDNNQPNLYGEVICQGFELDAATTAILSSQCHSPFRTETVDLLLAALIWSFQKTFADRSPPAIFNEGHGREMISSRNEVDMSHTVGWFTTLLPIALSSHTTFVEALIQTKDLRRRVPGNGRPYFATRFLNPEGTASWGAQHRDMEISFNFLGRYQQLERDGALLQSTTIMAGEAHTGSPTADFGHAAQRFALFEISAVIVNGALRFGFAWNRRMRHHERIGQWLTSCQQTLADAASTLPVLEHKFTIGDLPLLPRISPEDLHAFEKDKLPVLAGHSGWHNVEDIYPTSPIQQGLLVSRAKNGSSYAVRRVFRAKPHDQAVGVLDIGRLVLAWKGVVRHHALLRTVFIQAVSKSQAGGYDQLVLKDVEPLVLVRECGGDENSILQMIRSFEPVEYQADRPQHRFSVFYQGQTTGDVFCVLEISHAIMDGTSMDILLRDLRRSYTKSLDRLPKPLFAPFVASLLQRDAQKDIEFWTSYLGGIEPCHFPVLNDGVDTHESERELRTLRVDFPRLEALQGFCDARGFTLANAFHVAWALVLACYSGTDDVCFGYLVSGRDDTAVGGSQEAVGPFINMATQRVQLGTNNQLCLLQVLEAVQRDQLECIPYAQTSLAEIQHALRTPGGVALFNTCVSYRRRLPLDSDQPNMDSLVCQDLEAIHDPTEYPISLNIEIVKGEAIIDLDFWTDAVACRQADNIAATLVQTLCNITESAGCPISALDKTHRQTKELMWSWNANMPSLTADCIHRMVEKQVAHCPHAQAIRGWDADFTYEEMNILSTRLARFLIDLGVGPEVLIPVCFDKSAWTVIAMLAILKAGGGVVPLDPTHPPQALQGKVVDAGAHIVVTSEIRASIFASMVPHTVVVGPTLLGQLSTSTDKVGDDIPIPSRVSPENPAFVMFTSGSTGKPKGVVLCHQALASSCLAHGSALGVGEHTRFLQFATYTFDNSIEEMFTTLIHGGCVCVPSDADRLDDLAGAIDRLDANFMDLTPTVAALLRPEQVPKIKGIAVGGEALTQEVLDIWGDAVPLHNQYGPSECSINATHRLHTTSKGDVANLGTSVGSVSWVVDAKNHDLLVPIGCIGELLIEGPILAREYLGKPAETAKAFIETPDWARLDPHHGERGIRRMYKTGDLVRYNSDGSLIYLGRKDTQVKLHGQRIELGEIEHHVKSTLPLGIQSSVDVVSTEQAKKALAVFICLELHSTVSGSEEPQILAMSPGFRSLAQTIVSGMGARVAAYMVPTIFLPVSKMPLTSSGKLDRRCLRTRAQSFSDAGSDGMMAYRLGAKVCNGRSPETRMEKLLQELWSVVLNVDPECIGADDSFFSHGGDSIGAMRLVPAARQKGVTLSVANIFQMPRLSHMARGAILGAEGSGEDSASSSGAESFPSPTEPFSLIMKTSKTSLNELKQLVASICRFKSDCLEDIYPCTPLQAGLVAASQRQPGAYVAVNSYELPVGTDILRFEKAWQQVAESEAILRTRIIFLPDVGFLQIVIRSAIEWIKAKHPDHIPTQYSQLPSHDGDVLSRHIITTDPNTGRHTFIWMAHHALYDGWSLSTLLGRVEEHYLHPEVPMIQVPHYSRFIEYVCSLDVSASDTFWSSQLSCPSPHGTTPQHFPPLPRQGYRTQATSRVSRSIFFAKPGRFGLTTVSLLRATWAMVLSIYSSSDDVVFGEILNGRDVPVAGIEHLAGPTFASIPRRIYIDRSLSVEQLLLGLQGQFNDAIPHQFAGLQRIKTLGPGAAAACEFQNLFAIDNTGEDANKGSLWENLASGGTSQGTDFFNYPLNVTCTVDQGRQIVVRAHFDSGVVPQWQVKRMLSQFETTLQRFSAITSQHDQVGNIDLLNSEDKASIREWNEIPGPLVERRVHDMISDQMAREGDSKSAVVGWDATLSNGELDSLSTSLARELLARGVGSKGSRFVPFCFEKSTFAVVVILAVLKAGAAFVPLDPTHPVGRLREIIMDCSAGVILCSPRYEGICSELVQTVIKVDADSLKKLQLEDVKEAPLDAYVPCYPHDPAYVIFTSGTTGKPKGTIVTHSSFCSGAAAHGPAMLMRPPFRFLQFASYTFDASLVEILTTLMMGGTVCVPREVDRTNGNIAAAIEEMGVDMALLTPSFARTLQPRDVPNLKTLILGGEAMTQSHLATWADKVNLVNAYGPSECAVVATVNPKMNTSSNPSNLGRGIGRCWVVNPKNHNRLAPLGSIGELVIEGPTLSIGYLQNGTKTREVFIEDPQWALDERLRYPDIAQQPRRMYKTGDLVRVCDDATGEMVYVGRKDTSQAKLNGQRLEVDEIAHHLDSDNAVRHAVVIFPQSGPCAKRIVAVLTFHQISATQPSDGILAMIVSKSASSFVGQARGQLVNKLPPYMIPSTWIVLGQIPLLPSGKLDRASVTSFVEGMSEEALDAVSYSDPEESPDTELLPLRDIPIHDRLKAIWSEVLNINTQRVTRKVSFLHLGGDSITAMQVMARCRTHGIQVTVQDIISSQSVHELALKVVIPQNLQRSTVPDEDHHDFEPSPIQQLYFKLAWSGTSQRKAESQFNQSVLLHLQVSKGVTPTDVNRGIHALVETHSMLRTRFTRNGAGTWRQRITSDVSGSYRHKTHTISNLGRMEKRIQNSQRALDIEKGPLLASDCFTLSNGKDSTEVYVFITIHHLVVDIVSWGILLQDLEDFFSAGAIKTPPSMSFQAWSRVQSQRAQAEDNGPALLPQYQSSSIDLEYWGMVGVSNTHGDVITAEAELDYDATALLLGPECHLSLQTEPLDVLLAALLLSYRDASMGRHGAPTIYNEGHGREMWEDGLDLSRTVGWFTTLCPVHLPYESLSDRDIVNAIRWVKDYRKRLPGKGRPYFAHQMLTSQGYDGHGQRWPVEVTFNYLGQMQQLSRTDTILQSFNEASNSLSDIGKDVPRFALIDVSARVADGKMQISFAYNKHMKHQASIRTWAQGALSFLQEGPQRLARQNAEKTLSDFPLMSLSYYGLENLHQSLEVLHVKFQDVEDIYPCSPMQCGLLLSQMKDPGKYAYRATFQLESTRQHEVDVNCLLGAWQAVIQRHSTLRTVFIDMVGDEGLMNQVVLRKSPGRVQILHSSNEQALDVLRSAEAIDFNEKRPPHCLTVCKTANGHVFCRLEISHVICDGSSMPILLKDLSEAYAASSETTRGSIPSYRDYMAYLLSQPREKSIRYWKEYLIGAEPCLFPALTDGVENAEPSLGSRIIHLEDVAKINDFCANLGITLSTLFQLAWALVVRTYTGSDEVLFGYLSSGRDIPVPQIESAVGAFINMLVCRLDIPAEAEVGDLIDTMRTNLAEAIAHQTCSLAEIQHELHLPGTALFNTAFTYQKRTASEERDHPPARPALEYRVVNAEDPSEYAIAVNVEATDKSVEIHFSYWRNIVSDAQMLNVASTFEQVVKDLAMDERDDRTVGELHLVSGAGVEQLVRWNNYELPGVECCVHDVIAQHARQFPQSTPAICAWDTTFTYRQLDDAAAALANHLLTVKVFKPDTFIPLCFEKSAWTVVAQLAVLKAGGAFVNLDPAHPESRLRELMQDIDADIVLSSVKHAVKMARIANRTVIVGPESVKSAMTAQRAAIASSVKPYNAAYIIFTSGTTGKPKGTVVEHGSFCTGAMAHAKAMFMRADSRVLQFASYTFDASIMETLSCLLVGGCICIPSDEDRINNLGAVIRNMGVTWTLLTPSVASTLKPESVSCLRTLVTGGEAMSAGHVTRWGTRCALVNAYGPTECSVVATTSIKVDESHRVCNTDSSDIGTAVGGRVWVVDPHTPDRLAPIGAVGELVVEGRLVARGYLNREEQTAKVFIESPAWTRQIGFPKSMWQQSTKMYRTGDLVRYNSDGSVSYVARKDTQIKLNGRRIELGEIEFHCRGGLPEDAQVAVEMVEPFNNSNTTKALAIFFALSDEAASTKFSLLPMNESTREIAQMIEKNASTSLPAYMVPQYFVRVATMPWTTAGKLDRRQLRQALEQISKETLLTYKLTKAAASAKRHTPASELEKTLQGLWETALGLIPNSVSSEDDFFRLGGDSLTAMRLVGLARAHRIRLLVLDVFEHPILANMARSCGSLEATSVLPKPKPFELVTGTQLDTLLQEVSFVCGVSLEHVQDVYPCTPLQEALVALAHKQTGAYVAVNTLKLSRDIDIMRFKAAWQAVVDDTDTLRTRIVHNPKSEFLQVVVAPAPIHWFNEGTVKEAIDRGGVLGSQNGGELARYALVQHDDGASSFIWAIHHALYDGWSLPRIAKRVQNMYDNSGPRACQQVPYASFIRFLGSKDVPISEEFWIESLRGASSTTHFPQLPTVAQRESPKFQAVTCQIGLNRSVIRSNMTIPTLVRAAWAITLASYTGTDDVVFGETLAGRNIDLAGVEDMAGPTFATVPTRVQVQRDLTLAQFLQSLQKSASRVVPHQHLGLQHIKRLNADCAGACEFQNILIIQSSSSSERQNDAWKFEGGASTESFFTHPLVLECNVTGTGIEATLHHDEHVLSVWQTERLIHQLEAVLKQLVHPFEDQQTTVADIHVISPEDHALLEKWNGPNTSGDTDIAADSCIHQLFIATASTHPERLGINGWDDQLTYAEIRDYASRVAFHLHLLGVGHGALVPVCLTRSTWSIVTLLGILMAGGAFVPFDSAHPLTRQKDMLASISPTMIVCSPEHISHFSQVVGTCVPVDGQVIQRLPSPPSSFIISTNPTDAAYLLFTSGSTGRPKGVLATHGAFCSSSRGYALATKMGASSRVFHFASLTFDVALMEILTPLTLGACVCVPTDQERLHDLGAAMTRLGATWAFLTPSVANLVDPQLVGPTLKTLVCGGEGMLAETIARWAERVELMNGYGPTEACVLALVNPNVSTQRDRSVIGRATTAGRAWIVEPRNQDGDWLAPIGAVGELAISGSLLAQGYFNDPEKTAQVFIDNPVWGTEIPVTRAYRTGDLVKYRPDGTIEFIGRNDGQVKVNGQRIELGEIESRLSAHSGVKLALVVQPKSGPCDKQLVAVITLSLTNPAVFDGHGGVTVTSNCKPTTGSPEWMAKVRREVHQVRSRLDDTLPHYMVPAAWIVIEAMPVVVSGKLDRQAVLRWVSSLDRTAYERITGDLGLFEGEENVGDVELTETAKALREVWAEELRVPVDRIQLNMGFLSLGGDSIMAMGIVSRARKAKIIVSMQDVLRSKSVIHLAVVAKSLPGQASAKVPREDETGELFPLSPIQRLYFKLGSNHVGEARFNQSFALPVSPHVSIENIKRTMDALVQRHSMLRVRFSSGQDGEWQQRIPKMNSSTYGFFDHTTKSANNVTAALAGAQSSLCIKQGPVFRADVFEGLDKGLIISMVAHHLCVDMVSWRIIVADLNDFIEKGSLDAELPPSFHSLHALQASQIKHLDPATLLPFKETQPDLAYWEVHQPLTYGCAKIESFTLDEDMTKLALSDCHTTFRTEPTDLLLAAIAYSFAKTFTDRGPSTLYSESHGRESPQYLQMDLTRTVGWFTTICPLPLPIQADSIMDTVRRAKDIRRSIPDNGRSHFSSTWLGNAAKGASLPMEILFNYLGNGFSEAKSDDAPSASSIGETSGTADVGPDARRMALFEISAIVVNGKLQFSFIYDNTIPRVGDVHRWIGNCKTILEEMILGLISHPPEPTLSDYPLLPLTYSSLRALVQGTLPGVGIDNAVSEVEDIYPCTPVQEGMLISQLRNPDAYIYHAVYNIQNGSPEIRVDTDRLTRAWQRVVDRHPALRTVFVESVHRRGVFDQAVLRKVGCGVVVIQSGDDEALGHLGRITMQRGLSQSRQPRLPHLLTVCATNSGKVILKLETNHAALDGGSLAIILQELAAGYGGTLADTPGPLYSDYIRYIRSLPTEQDCEYWMRYLQDIKPCHIPKLNLTATGTRCLCSTTLEFHRFPELRQLSERAQVTLASIMHTAWALVLRKYTGSDDVCFGYLTADRDAPVNNIQHVVGTLINMLCCRVQVTASSALEQILQNTQEQHIQSMQFQRSSLAQVQHELGLGGRPLHNTSISTQSSYVKEKSSENHGISFELEEGHDPSEYVITVNVDVSKGGEGVVFRYWSDHITDHQAQDMAHFMAQILNTFIDRPAQSVSVFDLSIDTGVSHYVDSPPTFSSEDSGDQIFSPEPWLSFTPPTESSSPVTPDGRRTQKCRKETLAAIWKALLNMPSDQPVSGKDNFFDVGGDSIMAIKLVGDARDHGLNLSVADVFRNPLFDDIVATARFQVSAESTSSGDIVCGTWGSTRRQTSSKSAYERFSLLAASSVDAFLQTNIIPQVGVFRGGLLDVLPATDFQSLAVTGALLKSRWMMNYFHLDGHGPFDVAKLKRACYRLVQGLDILRTVFVPSGGRILQVVLRTVRPSFRVIETQSESFDDFTEGLLQRYRDEGEGEEDRTRQLGQPLVSFTLIKHDRSRRHKLLVRISHAQYDGVCFPKILEALQAAYQGKVIAPSTSFANYLRASAGSLTSEQYQHWKKLLDGSSMTEIVRRTKPNYHKSCSGASTCLKKNVQLPPVSSTITTATVVKAAWAYVLAQISTSPDVVFGHTISGRNADIDGVENMIGPCLNLVPVRVCFGGQGQTASDLFRQVQDQQVANMPYEVLGFREIIRHCTAWPNWTYFTSIVQHQNIEKSTQIRLGDVSYEFGCASAAPGDFADLSVFSQRQDLSVGDSYEIVLSFAKDGPVERGFAERALQMLCKAARLFATNPNIKLQSADDICNHIGGLPLKLSPPSPKSSDTDVPAVLGLKQLDSAQLLDFTQLIVKIWTQVLGDLAPSSARIGLDTSFFDIGGDMVGLAQVALLLGNEGFPMGWNVHFLDLSGKRFGGIYHCGDLTVDDIWRELRLCFAFSPLPDDHGFWEPALLLDTEISAGVE